MPYISIDFNSMCYEAEFLFLLTDFFFIFNNGKVVYPGLTHNRTNYLVL